MRASLTSSRTKSRKKIQRRSVQSYLVATHNYVDLANEPFPDNALAVHESILASDQPPFPVRLFHMLDHITAEGDSSIVSWQPHGRCFLVHKAKEFEELLPIYFKLSKVASFCRQLNLYGFKRLTHGPDKGAYYHMCFLRGRSFLLSRMKRVKVKGTGVRARANPKEEPDFWSMKRVDGSEDLSKRALPQNSDQGHRVVLASPMVSDSKDSAHDDCSASRKVYTNRDRPLNILSKDLYPNHVTNSTTSLIAWSIPTMFNSKGQVLTGQDDRCDKFEIDLTIDDSFLDLSIDELLRGMDDLF